jgi:transglutaminase-like putative cysteine protease
MERRPAALVSVPIARLAGYALLAAVGSLQWVRYVEGASSGRAIAWAVAGTATGALVIAARGRGLWLAAAAAIGAGLAVAASGLDLTYLEPKHLDELGDGLSRGAEALNTVRLPYLGKEPWVLTTVQLSGAGICWLAALLATWPTGGRVRAGALVLLLTLAAAPVISLGADRPGLLGVALAVLTAAFLWLERLARRPGLGAVVLAALVAVTAVPLGAAADREEPWFDYKAFSAKLSGGVPVSYSWDHDYGPITWTRDGIELFRVESDRPYYWKADVLNTFDDDRWIDAVPTDPGGDEPVDDLPRTGRHHEWDAKFSVALRRLKTPSVVGAGTVLGVSGATTPVEPDVIPGVWTTSGAKELSKGDSYEVRAHVPRPTQRQLAAATVGRDPRRASALGVSLEIRPDAIDDTPYTRNPFTGEERHAASVDVHFAPYESGRPPRAVYREYGVAGSGPQALRNSHYARTWALAQRLRRSSTSPYDYLLRVNDYLRSDDFVYTEVPDKPSPGVPPLEAFLLDSKRGYCQHFAGGMALLLRMGGIPARVVTGFSPGGQRASTGEWVVRDTDAHSWVEAWFDGIGWATFDPTPPDTPARSQIAAINPAPADDQASGGDESTPLQQNPRGPLRDTAAPRGGGQGGGDDGTSWPWLAAGALLAAAIMAGAVVSARRRAALSTPEAALAELERALRRSGRGAPVGMTLTELDRRLGTASTGYIKALRAARYAPRGTGAGGPNPGQRAAFRRELAVGLGWGGRLRAYYALPPTLPNRRPR